MHLPNYAFQRTPRCLAAFAFMCLSSCTMTDTFGSRAVAYNQQTADSKSTSVLLNIIRAAYTRPLQFTEVTTVSGQGSAAFAIGSNLPLFLRGPGSQLYSISPSIAASGTDTFNIANLNSQEFYQGIQNPLKIETIGYYLLSGLDPNLVLTLMLSNIYVDDGVNKSRLRNTAEDASFNAFYTAVSELIVHGLSVEPTQGTRSIGPALTEAQVSDSKFLANLLSSVAGATPGNGSEPPTLRKFEVGKDSDPELTESDKRRLKGSSTYYRFIKSSSSLRFCFDRLRLGKRPFQSPDLSRSIDFETVPDAAGGEPPFPIHLGMSYGKPIGFMIRVEAADVCGSGAIAANPFRLTKDVKFTPRSVEEIFGFLGEMTRRELGLAGKPPFPMEVPDGHGGWLSLFLVQRSPSSPQYFAATLDNESFFAAVDPSGRDRSSRVIQLLTDLLALNSSAKNLPAPSAIPLIVP